MKVVAISDLHGNLPEIPECDLLLISGDICIDCDPAHEVEAFGKKMLTRSSPGSRAAIFEQSKWLGGPFAEWLDKIPAKHVVACWGNHDYIGERAPEMVPKSLRWHILTDQMVTIEGLTIFSSPWQNWFYDWAFNAPPGAEGDAFMDRKFSFIPEGTDIIICHGPPFGYGDLTDRNQRTGSKPLIEHIKRVKPKLTVHGHIHSGRGIYKVPCGNREDIIICNASILNEAYEMVYSPMVFDIPVSVVESEVVDGEKPNSST